ncbi:AAR2 protein-domain-containing protein [Triangularia setosa]|uniref:AAR2 protein-domain-containing protein n=1 Tax=Triangularia setosa TaxID=2587417 RepID=A0AAN6W1F3_9PEZI|nr:AAR2 protein-domain-containing protein [Podospora setosa]
MKQRLGQRSWKPYEAYDTDDESTPSVPVRPQERTTEDALRILDLPDNFTIGLDMMTMTTTSSLQGFCQIPPGAHFLWVQQPGVPFRSGYWFVTKYRRRKFRIKKWDKFNEVLADATPDEKNAVDGRRHEKLAPYALDEPMSSRSRSTRPAVPDHSLAPTDSLQLLWSRDPTSLWVTLTDNIVPASLSRVTSQPLGRDFHVDSTTDHRQNPPSEAGASTTADRSSQFNFVWADSMPGTQIHNGYLGRLWPGTDEPNETQMREMLSDLQFTFLTGTLLSNLACLEQWWNLVLNVVLKCWALAERQTEFVSDMVTILHAQLYFTEVCLQGDSTLCSDGGSGSGKGKSKTEAGPNPDRALYQVKIGYKEKLKNALESYRREMENHVRRRGGHEFAEARKRFEGLECFLFGLGWDFRSLGSVRDREGDGEDSSSEDEDGEEGVDWNSEDDDDEPVIVELDEEGREVGLVSFND